VQIIDQGIGNKMIEFVVPCVPVAKPRPRASQAGGFTRIYTPTGGAIGQFIASVRLAATDAYTGPPLQDPLRVDCEFVFPRPKGKIWKTKPMPREWKASKPDRDNLDKAVLDALNGLIWRDDSQVVDGRITKQIAAGDEQPHVKIWIRSVS